MKRYIQTLFPLVAITFLLGCETETETTANAPTGDVQTDTDEHAGHSHGDPPHGGTYADWGGGKYHVEFTVDHDKQEATVYILGDDAQSAEPIDATEISLAINDPAFQVVLTATPLDGDADGKSSRFVGTHENLGIVKEYAGKIFGSVDGKAYSGDFKELPHDHDHDH